MFDVIKKFAVQSLTLKEARENVEEMSLAKEMGIYIILFLILYVVLVVVWTMFGYILGPDIANSFISLFSFALIPILI